MSFTGFFSPQWGSMIRMGAESWVAKIIPVQDYCLYFYIETTHSTHEEGSRQEQGPELHLPLPGHRFLPEKNDGDPVPYSARATIGFKG